MKLCIFFSEESSAVPGVGVEKLVETKMLDFLRKGPLFWVDSADSHPCMGKVDTIYVGATPPLRPAQFFSV